MFEEQNTHKLTGDEVPQWAATETPTVPTLHLPVNRDFEDDDFLQQTTVKRAIVAVAASPSSLLDLPTLPFTSVKPSPTPHPTWRGVSTIAALLLFVIVNLVVQVYRRPLEVAGDGFYGLRRVQQCESLGRVPDVIYLGSSRTVYSGDAHLVDDEVQQQFGTSILGCNVGTFSSTIAQDYYTLKRLIEDGFTPKVVVETLWEYNININASGGDPADGLSAADIAWTNTAQIMNLADVTNTPDLMMQFSHDTNDKNALVNFMADKLVPLYGTRIGLLKTACGSLTIGPCGATTPGLDAESLSRYTIADNLGWVGVTNSSIATLSRTVYKNHLKYYSSIATGIANFKIGGHQPTYLADLVALAQAHGIHLVLVAPPVHHFLLDYLTHPSDWQMIMDYWQGFANQHGVPFYDMSRAPGYTDADFIDPQHLDATGAQKYATWLASSVIGPLVTSGG